MPARHVLIAPLSILFGIFLVVAADAPALKKPQGGRKLSYSLSNSSNTAVTIILTAFSPNNQGSEKFTRARSPLEKQSS